jgi:hypothetical protein
MALSEEDKQEIRQFLKEEREQERQKILSSVENFRNYLETVHKIFVVFNEAIKLFNFFRQLFF